MLIGREKSWIPQNTNIFALLVQCIVYSLWNIFRSKLHFSASDINYCSKCNHFARRSLRVFVIFFTQVIVFPTAVVPWFIDTSITNVRSSTFSNLVTYTWIHIIEVYISFVVKHLNITDVRIKWINNSIFTNEQNYSLSTSSILSDNPRLQF